MRTAAGYLGMQGDVHTVMDRGEPALEVRQTGLTSAPLCIRRGCSPGQRCSQRPYMGAPSAPRAMGTLTVPTAYYRSHMVAVHGRPGHILSRIGVGGIAFSNLWAWAGFGSPTRTHLAYTPLVLHGCLLRAVYRVRACTSNYMRDK